MMILVVEDDEIMRFGLSEFLDIMDYPTKTAADGQEALDLLGMIPFDAVLLDLMLPCVNGYEVLQHIKAEPTLNETPMIVISALNSKENIQRCIDLGASAFLAKPFTYEVLQAHLDDLLGG